MLNINTNYAASFAANAAKRSQLGLDSAMEKLSSGSRINYAKDDAAGLALAKRIEKEVQGLAVASRNAADAQSLLDTADGALGETHNLLLRMRELAVQSSNGTLQSSDRTALDAEFEQLKAEVDRIDTNTKWAGTTLFDGAAKSFQIGTGNTANDRITVNIADMSKAIIPNIDHDGDGAAADVAAAGGNPAQTAPVESDISTAMAAQATIAALDTAINTVSAERGEIGAISNRLSSTVANLDQIGVNLSASQARIQDADFAAETGNLAKNQILQQAATAMLAQANASKGTILTLIN
jgi:flagellin